ncbi:MAG: hypothetical protein Q8L78_07880 [Coxiellaceae bacterium]|nr:hypothetical protein [Coxiellaceae bacterium]
MSINLLPWRTEAICRYRKKCVFISLFFIVFMTLLVGELHLHLKQKMRVITTDIHTLKNGIANIPLQSIQNNQTRLKKLLLLQSAKKMANAKIMALENALTLIANDLPTTATLTTLILSDKQNVLIGESSGLSDAHNYTQKLQKDLSVKEVSLSDVHNSEGNKALFNFSIQVTT